MYELLSRPIPPSCSTLPFQATSSWHPQPNHNPLTALHLVARTPSRLTDLLLSRGISQPTLDAHLQITQGDVKDATPVTTVLSPPGRRITHIISGIGMIIGLHPDTTICATALSSILSAVKALKPVQPPHLTVISTTGISAGARDVPLLMVPLYRGLLSVPHKDKKAMEDLVVGAGKEGVVAGWTVVRASLLTNGKATEGKVRAGMEGKPAVGYTISREDVGGWIYREVVVKGAWVGERVSLSY